MQEPTTLNETEQLAIYRAMVRIRVIDERMVKLQRQGRIAFHVGCEGEEAAIIASAAALRAQDWIAPCYREVAALLWRGYPLQKYVDHMFGNADDPTLGRQMPDHVYSREHRYLSVSAPIGTQIPHAVGLSWAAQKKGRDDVAAVYFGDGATSSNDFHAAMNFAAVFNTPTVFLCRNNGWAISLPSSQQTKSKDYASKADAYGMRSMKIDGNDVLATHAAVTEAVSLASTGQGPTMIELVTYRLGGHSTSDDPTAYRANEEVGEKLVHDPVVLFRGHLCREGHWDDNKESKLIEELDAEVRACVSTAEAKPMPPTATLFEDVYAEQPWHLREQSERCQNNPHHKGKG